MAALLKNKFLRFLAVGVLNTAFGYSIFAFFLYCGFHYSLAALLGTVLGVLFNFKSTGRLVFGNRNNTLIFRFVGVYCVTYIVNVLFLRVFNGIGVSMYIAGAVLLLPLAILSFFLNKFFVFSEGGK